MARVELAITPLQVKCIADRNAAVERASQRLSDVLSGIVAGHGYDVVQIVAVNDETNTLTIETIEPADG